MPRRGAPPVTYRTFPNVADEAEPSIPFIQDADAQIDAIKFTRMPYQWKVVQERPVAGDVTSMPAAPISESIPTMSLPPHGPGRRRGMDQVTWFSSVKVKRDKGSVGLGRGDLSSGVSPSRTRGTPSSGARSLSRSRESADRPDLPQDVPDECSRIMSPPRCTILTIIVYRISMVMKKLNGKVQHEKVWIALERHGR